MNYLESYLKEIREPDASELVDYFKTKEKIEDFYKSYKPIVSLKDTFRELAKLSEENVIFLFLFLTSFTLLVSRLIQVNIFEDIFGFEFTLFHPLILVLGFIPVFSLFMIICHFQMKKAIVKQSFDEAMRYLNFSKPVGFVEYEKYEKYRELHSRMDVSKKEFERAVENT